MSIYSPYTEVTELYTFPSTPDVDSVDAEVIFDDTGDVIAGTVSNVSGDQYQVVIADDLVDSGGTYSIKWTCTVSSVAFYAFTSFQVADVYCSSTTFFTDYPEYNSGEFLARFDARERDARRIIDTYTGQNFQYIKNKTYQKQGSGRNTLYLDRRILSFSSVLLDSYETTTYDATLEVELDVKSHFFLKCSSPTVTFDSNATVSITGDWGWRQVPWEIQQAAELLIVDLLDDTRREHKRYGIQRIWQDTNRLEFHPSILNSTGNTDVDTLLMDYVIWTMDYVT